MQQFEFAVTTDLSTIASFPIAANFDEAKAALAEMMKPYAGMVVTAETVAQAKADAARINKVIARLDETRKAVKKACAAPYEAVEPKFKALTDEARAAYSNLKTQIDGYAEAAKAEKLNELKAFFAEAKAESSAGDFLSFDDLTARFPKWGNATYSIDTAKSDIQGAIRECEEGAAAILALNSKFQTTLLDEFRRTHDLAGALRRNAELTATAERWERLAAQRKAEAEAEEAKIPPMFQRQPPKPAERPREPEVSEKPSALPVRAVDFRVWVNGPQLAALKVFLVTNDIRYGKVPKGEEDV